MPTPHGLRALTINRSLFSTLDKAGKPIIYDASHYTTEGATEVITALRAKGLLAETLSEKPLAPALATSDPLKTQRRL